MASFQGVQVRVWLTVRNIYSPTCSSKVQQNGMDQSSGGEGSGKVESLVELRKRRSHMRSQSHTNRLSYLEAVSLLIRVRVYVLIIAVDASNMRTYISRKKWMLKCPLSYCANAF